MIISSSRNTVPTLYRYLYAVPRISVLTGGTLGTQFGDGAARVQLVLAVVVVLAVERVAAQRKLVAGNQMLGAHTAPETVDVEDLIARPHHHVGAAEQLGALAALGAEQPAAEGRMQNVR